MGSWVKARLTFANVMSVVAVFVALGGSAIAVTRIDRNSVRSKQVKNNSLANVDLRNDTIQGNKVNEATLEGVKAGNVTAFHVSAPPDGGICTADTPVPEGVAVTDPAPGSQGTCTVTFPQSVFGCSVQAAPDHRKIDDAPSTIQQETAQVFRTDESPDRFLVSTIRAALPRTGDSV